MCVHVRGVENDRRTLSEKRQAIAIHFVTVRSHIAADAQDIGRFEEIGMANL
jgi:hypothetical protein